MPLTHSASKRVRQTRKRAKLNSLMKVRIDKARKEIRRLAGTQLSMDIQKKLNAFASLADKAEQKGVLKRNVAARTKSRLFRSLRPKDQPSK